MLLKNSITVNLDGTEYSLRSDDGEERLNQIASLVEEKISKIREASPRYSTTRTAMLAALQLADELITLREEYAQLLSEADIGGNS